MPYRVTEPAPVDIYLISASPFDPVTGTTVNVYATTHKYFNTEAASTPASTSFRPGAQVNGFKLSTLDLEGGMIGGFLSGATGEILIPNTDRELDAWLRYSWMGRTVTVSRVAKGVVGSSGGTTILKGYVTGVSADRRNLRIAFESLDAALERKPLSPTKFWGRPRALRFGGGGANHSVTCGDNCDMTGSFTIEFLYKLNGASGGANAPIVSKDTGAAGYAVWHQTTNVLRFTVRGGHAFNTSTQNTGEWHFYSFVYDTAANMAYAYVDGALNNSTSATVDPTATAAILRFGGDGGTTHVINGDLAEVRIWNVARTQQQILENLYGGISSLVIPSSLVGWWRFEEGSGATLNDSSATNADGTITGATWQGTYEGDEALGGRRKPIGYGGNLSDTLSATTPQPYIEPTLIDSQKLIYSVDVRGFQAAMGGAVPPVKSYDGGSEITSGGNTTDLWGTTVSVGQFKYDESRGLIRLNAAPSKRLSVRYQPIGGSGNPGSMIGEILEYSAGFSSSDYFIDAADFSEFAVSGNGGAMVYSVDGEMTCAEAIRQILHSFRCWGGFGENGIFGAEPITRSIVSNSSVHALSDQQYSNLTLVGVLPPAKSVLVRYRPYLPPHSDQEVATSVSADTKRDLMREYREVRVTRELDRFGSAFSSYRDDARELVIQTTLNLSESAVAFGASVLDLFDTFVPVWEMELLDPDVTLPLSARITIGHQVSITDPAFSLNGTVKCLVVGTSRTIVGSKCRMLVQLAEVPTLAS